MTPAALSDVDGGPPPELSASRPGRQSSGFVPRQHERRADVFPAAWVPVAPIIVGYPKAETPPVARREPEIRWVG